MALGPSTEAILAEDLAPRHTDAKIVSSDHKDVIRFCNRLVDEARAWRTELGLAARTQRAFDFLNSNQFLRKSEADYRARVVVNLFRSNVERKIAMLSDSVPQLDVRSHVPDLVPVAAMLKDNCEAQWEEAKMQLVLQDMELTGSMEGSCPVTMMWDAQRERLRSDTLHSKDVLLDRGLGRARRLQSDSLFVIVHKVRPLSEFWHIYKEAGRRVRPDPSLSQFELPGDEREESAGIGVRSYVKPSSRGRESQFYNSAIPMAEEYRLYFRDPTVDPLQPDVPDSELPNLLFPRKRVIVWSRDTLLFDGQNQNWDGNFPLEVFDWGIEQNHPYGNTELQAVETIQVALNLLTSGVVHGARLANNPPSKMSEGAMEPEDLAKFRKYGDRPGWTWVIAPNSTLEFMPPQPQGSIVQSTIELLRDVMQQIMGVSSLAMGDRPEGNAASGVAIDSLLLASQYTIRLQARSVEAMLERLGTLMVSRILQYFSDERISYKTDIHSQDLQSVLYRRADIIKAIAASATEMDMNKVLEDMNRHFSFHIKPYSALAVAQLPKIQLYERFADKHWVRPVEVMKVAGIADPENEYEMAQQLDAQQQARIQMAMQQQQQEEAAQKQQAQQQGQLQGALAGAGANGPPSNGGPPSGGHPVTRTGPGPGLPKALTRVPPTILSGAGGMPDI